MKKKDIHLKQYVWLFVLGCFLGFILETLWYFIKHGEFINKQGLLYGPFKPIYGIGLVIIVLFMQHLQKDKFIKKFIVGVLIGSAFEYIGSLFQEYVFGTYTWTYASFNLNIGGRIYLPYCLAWGLIAVFCIDCIYPLLVKIGRKIPLKVQNSLTIVVAILMIINVILTALATVRYADRTNEVERNSAVFRVIDNIYPDEYMHKKFPKLRVVEK